MFSGFGDINSRFGSLTADLNLSSISDFNQRFAQLASQLSLDNLQTDDTTKISSANHSNDVVSATAHHEDHPTQQAKEQENVERSLSNITSVNQIHLDTSNSSMICSLPQENVFEEKRNISFSEESQIPLESALLRIQSLEAENSSLKASLSEQSERNAFLESQITALSESLQLSRDETGRVSKSVDTLTSTVTALELDNERLKFEILKVNESLQSVQLDRDTLASSSGSLTDTLNSVQRDYSTVKQEMQDMEQSLLDLQAELESSNAESTTLKSQLRALSYEHKESLSRKENDLQSALKKFEDLTQKYRDDKDTWTHRLETLQAQLKVGQLKESVDGELNNNSKEDEIEMLNTRIIELESSVRRANEESLKNAATACQLEEALQMAKKELLSQSHLQEDLNAAVADKIKLKEKLDKSIAALKSLKDTTSALKLELQSVVSAAAEEKVRAELKMQQMEEANESIISTLRAELVTTEKKSLDLLKRNEELVELINESSVSKNQNSDLVVKLQTELTEVRARNSELCKSLDESNARGEGLIKEMSEREAIHTINKQTWDLEFKNLQNSLAEMQKKNSELTERISELTLLLEEKSSSLNDLRIESSSQQSTLLTENASMKKENSELSASLAKALSTLSDKESQLADSKATIATLTEKTKEVMRKYADLKAKQSSQMESETSALQSKEAELLSLRLKFENFQRTAEDDKHAMDALTEKYNDLQRHHTRLQSSVASEIHEKEVLSKDLQALKDRFESLRGECNSHATTVQTLTLEMARQREDYEAKESAKQAIHLKQLQDLQSSRVELEAQHARAIAALRQELQADTSTYLEDYKKRAQTAVKQANAQVAQLEKEKQELRDEASRREIHARDEARREALNVAREETKELHEAIDALKSEQQLFIMKIESLTLELSRSKKEAEDARLEVQAALQKANAASFHTASTAAINRTLSPSSEESFVEIDVPRNASEEEFVTVNSQKTDGLVLTSQLQTLIDDARHQAAQRGIELARAQQDLQNEREIKKSLSHRVDELLAFIERSKQNQNPETAAYLPEYLKTCMYRYMATSELSEKQRLLPVIATLLKLTNEERSNVDAVLKEEEAAESDLAALSQIGSIASNFFSGGSLFGSSR